MTYHLVDRTDQRDVVVDDAGGEGWSDLLSRLPGLVVGDRPLVLDVSAVALLPAEVAALRQAIARLTGRDVRVACSRLSGRRLLRRLLPDEIAILLAGGVVDEPTADDDLAGAASTIGPGRVDVGS